MWPERSARAHATVTVDGDSADELWAAFRVGARARCQVLSAIRDGETRILGGTVEAAHGWRHERRLAYRPGQALVVVDRVLGHAASARVVSRVPLHPDWTVADGRLVAGTTSLTFETLAGRRGPPETGWMGDGFGVRRPRSVLTVEPDGGGGGGGSASRVAYAIAAPGAAATVRALLQAIQ